MVQAPVVGLPEPLNTWSGQPSSYPDSKTVAALFEETAATYPHRPALISDGLQISYSELNFRANRLAHRLRRMGVAPETLVACCLDRSLDLIVALLGILKAGGAYVPLDLSYPKERLEFLLEDTCAPLILTQTSLAPTLPLGRGVSLVLLDDSDSISSSDDHSNPAPAGTSATLAYVMYTSGSTGRPKGVMVENRSIVRLVRNTNYCNFGRDEVFLQFAPASFDASTFEIWGALLNGSTLAIAPPNASPLEDLGAIIRENGVTTLWLTAGLFHLMVERNLDALRPLRQLLAGGDVLSPSHVRRFLEQVPNCALINGYGPTENTTFTCCHRVTSQDLELDSIPIGRPVSNTQVYILDEYLRPVPPGTPGELYAAGAGLARGYLNDPEATAAKFLKSSFTNDPADRIYRTGDLSRWREDGCIEFLGRLDSQVKILGYRIEPGEIESVLGKHQGVQQACVVPQKNENGDTHLTAFFIPCAYPTASPRQLREFASEKLPRYMIPARFIALSAFPLSANGKIDRTALSGMSLGFNEQSPTLQSPTTQMESILLDLWSRALRVAHIGLDDNFFDLGGDSLLLLTIHSDLQRKLEAQIPVTDLFEFPTIRKLAGHLGHNHRQPTEPALVAAQQQARRQRDAFSRFRQHRGGGS